MCIASVHMWFESRTDKHWLICELILYLFDLDHNTIEAIKNIYCVKNEGTFNHITETRLFKKFNLSCKNLNNLARSGRTKTMPKFQGIEANLARSTRRVSGEVSISQFSVVHHLHNIGKSAAKLCFTLPKYCKTFE